MKKIFPLLLTLPLVALAGCNQEETIDKAPLVYGKMHGDISSWYSHTPSDDEGWASYSYLNVLDYAGIAGLIENKESFLLVVKGNDTTCSCWQGFHRSLGIYAKAKQVMIYVIEASELSKGSDFFGLSPANGVDELAIFKDGKVIHRHKDKDWGSNYVEVDAWISERIVLPKMFYVDEDQLSSLYEQDEAFFIYFKRGGCGDCQYIEKTSLKDYLLSSRKLEAYNFVFDLDPWRVIVDDAGVKHGLNDTTQYDEEHTWGEHVTAYYNGKKAEFGLADEEAGLDAGAVPTFYRIAPIGDGTKDGEVIQMAGVFYNDTADIENEKIASSYFSSERLTYGCLDYLVSSNVANKVLDGLSVPGVKVARTNRDPDAYHDAFRVYHEPIFYALLDAAILAE